MCPNCRAFIDPKEKVCPYCEVTVGPRAVEQRNPGEILGGLIPHARFTTVLILLVNTALYAATVLASLNRGNSSAFLDLDTRTLFDFGAKWTNALLQGQWWRLVTAGFLHGGFLHIAMNSWVLMDLGAQVEEIYGSSRLLVFYFFGTVFGFAASAWWNPGLSVGASAGIFALIGAMIVVGMRHNTALGAAIKGFYIRWAVYGFLMGLLPFFATDNAAHLGGLAAGFGFAWMTGEPGSGMKEKFWKGVAAGCLLLTGLSFLMMLQWLTRA